MTTIPQTDIAIDGDTAWLVDTPGMSVGWEQRNRPCDTCEGSGHVRKRLHDAPGIHRPVTCRNCGGTGRHTFTLDVECDECNESGKLGSDACWKCYAIGSKDITVHVVEVLPIYGRLDSPLPAGVSKWVWHSPNDLDADRRGTFLCEIIDNETQMTAVNLPAAAAPGMWAVRLAIHKENS